MNKLDNLAAPFTNEQSREEASKNGRKGGIASGEARRKKKLFKEEIEKQLGTTLDKVVASMIEEAQKGNVQASIFLRDTIGEKPKEEIEADVGINKIKVKFEDDE